MVSHSVTPSLDQRVASLSAMLQYICESPTPVHFGYHRAYGMIQACIALESISYDVVKHIHDEIQSVALGYHASAEDHQMQSNACYLAFDIMVDSPISFTIAPVPPLTAIIAEAKDNQ